jgi:hypothetical protein
VLRRRSLALSPVVGAILALAAVGVSAATAAGSKGGGVSDRDFRDPPSSVRPGFLWFWPGAAVQDEELRAEIEDMAAAGFRHTLLHEVPGLGVPPEGNPPEMFQWGTPHWAERVRTSFQVARDNDFTVDLSPSSLWPWRSPTVSGQNIELSAQQLGFGAQSVTGPSEHVGEPPPLEPIDEDQWLFPPEDLDPDTARLVAVTAARRDPSGTNAEGQKLLDPESTIDLTSSLDEQGKLHWDVPPGEWVLFSFWQGPASTTSTDPSGEVLDYMNRESLDVAADDLDQRLFSRLGSLPRQAGGLLHEDDMGCYGGRLAWTGAFLDEARSRRGYDLTPYLPALTVGGGACYTPDGRLTNTVYDFPGSVGERVRRDYAQTLTELWIDNHVEPMGSYAHRHGLESSGRPFSQDIGFNAVAVSKAYDVPDSDHAHNNTIDWTRTMTSGARLSGGVKAMSDSVYLRDHRHMTTPQILKKVDRQLVGGANVIGLHGYDYKLHKFDDRFDWPGWNWSTDSEDQASPAGWPESWSPEIPLWRHLPRVADYIARASTVLQAGRPVTDVAIYRDAYGFYANLNERWPILGGAGDTGNATEPALNSALTRSGFSFDMVDPGTVTERATSVQGKRLMVQPPGYKALVIDLPASKRVGVVDNTDAMAAPVARRLVSFARAGLPIVFVGQFPERGASYSDPEAEDAAVEEAITELKQSPNVRLAEDEAEVPAALVGLGVEGDLSFDGTEQSAERCGFGAQCVYSVHRRTGKGDYWFLWNDGAETARFTGSFNADRGVPEFWDLWSGDRRPIGLYREADDGRVEVPIELAPGETAMIGFDHGGKRKHVVSTTAEEVVVRDKELFLRSGESGEASAVLSDGREADVEFPGMPAPIEPATWDLHVDGAVPEGEERHDLELTELEDWREIPELEHTSGVGIYRTTMTLSKDWVDDERGAYLELGRAEGGVQVRVNGKLAHPAAVPAPRLDVGGFLRRGRNRIEVELTTTLNNRLAEISPDRNETQPYGLIGPVRLVPYADRAVG